MSQSLSTHVCFGFLLPESEGERLYGLSDDVDWISYEYDVCKTDVVISALHWGDHYLGFFLSVPESIQEGWSEPEVLNVDNFLSPDIDEWSKRLKEFVEKHRIFLRDPEEEPQWWIGSSYF